MDTFEVVDLYEAAYLLLNKCAFKGVECVMLAGKLSCKFAFVNDPGTAQLRELFRRREAVVNIYKFRLAYNTINSYMHQAKKTHDMVLRQAPRSCGSAADLTGGVVGEEPRGARP